jgi:hypothetical protein
MDKSEAASKLAEAHYRLEPGIRQIFRVGSTPDIEALATEPIKLLEVNENTIPAGILPLGFDAQPADGIHFPSIVIEVTPDELADIRSGRLTLPRGWQICEPLPRPVELEDATR